MSSSKIIAVAGATGSQGGGLVRAILADKSGEFRVRALTRDPNSAKAQDLAKAGAEVVHADVDDIESLKGAFIGCYGAFCVTFFWNHFSPEHETQQAANLAKAAAAAGVQHAIWSTLEDTREFYPLSDTRMPTLMGNYKVPHLDSKGEADKIFAAALPTTLLLTSFYWDNFIHFGMGPKRGADGKLTFSLPMADAKLAGIAAEDIGRCSYGIFKKGNEFIGKRVGVVGEWLTGNEMAERMAEAFGEPVTYQAIPFDVYRGLGFPGADDLGNMFQFFAEQQKAMAGTRSVEGSRALDPQLQDLRTWLAHNKDGIKLE
ncbi:NmrA-like protein [Candidatus Koribacter versatilis Ellin345]|uniref:NmrA-like protein n=1 Tax=Koribacter versatilis (strain Ellin345) TaxID=204669 RepID=Q1IKC4_KORVE|nr:NmrA/HSCARG family protein [Candidatus Koribacter versatilis]ABF42676.1 NmrA-like protein [Candidatus Koribacter versatilis Ellin345]